MTPERIVERLGNGASRRLRSQEGEGAVVQSCPPQEVADDVPITEAFDYPLCRTCPPAKYSVTHFRSYNVLVTTATLGR